MYAFFHFEIDQAFAAEPFSLRGCPIGKPAGILEEYRKSPRRKDLERALVEIDTIFCLRNGIARERLPRKIYDETSELDLYTGVNELGFSRRTRHMVGRAKIETLGELALCTKKQLQNIRGVGDVSLMEILGMLNRAGLSPRELDSQPTFVHLWEVSGDGRLTPQGLMDKKPVALEFDWKYSRVELMPDLNRLVCSFLQTKQNGEHQDFVFDRHDLVRQLKRLAEMLEA